MVVAANPGTDVTVAPELDLVKAAMLYGDTVTLISPVTTMLLGVEALQRFSTHRQIELMRRVAPVLLPAEEVPGFEQGVEQIDQFLRTTAQGGIGAARLRAGLLQQLQPIQQQLADAVKEIGHKAGIDELAAARAKGILQIENADPGDAVELLVACIVSAKLAETGERQDDSYSTRLVKAFVQKLAKHLSSGREYLIFDEPIADLTQAAIREGIFSPAKGPAGRSAQAMTASALMGRLPTFPTATVDEVLDIRTELTSSLTRFRAAMVTISKTFASAAWEADFEDEVHDTWVESVLPAVEAIDASVQDNRSLLALANGVAGAANTSYPGLAIAAAGLLGHVAAVPEIGAAISGTTPLLQALRDRKTADKDIRMQPFYFLYAVEQSLN
ncbi:MAG: hypothetical protein ACLQK4_06535 [Acidimicrobiales bacterium]